MDADFAPARALFEHCLSLDPASRDHYLSSTEIPPALRARVAAMLRAAGAAQPLLDHGPAEFMLSTLAAADRAVVAPPQCRGFELLGELGRGGMGAVWLARQQSPQRLVALKRLNAAATPASRERFRIEADALGRLQHPGIAAIHGVSEDQAGEPVLVIEYVDGAPLLRHARASSLADKLGLLAAIADAVEHAHARGVIHRDLKPGNILVTGDGQPKVLDFGIARLQAAEPDAPAPPTEEGTLLGTPAYMSPEQAAGTALDARSDVYALGVIGFELLCGRLPVVVSGMPPLLALQAIAHAEAPALSRVVPALRGDIEAVFATALARDPALRYATAAAFADDLRRLLSHSPVQARAPSRWRRLALFARRNPALSASFAVSVVALLAGALAASWFALGERRERLRAEQALFAAEAQRQSVEATMRFLSALLAEADPARSGRPDLAVRDILDRALPRVAMLPEAAQPALLLILADALSGYGADARITPLYEGALALAERHAAPTLAGAAKARLGGHLFALGHLVDARRTLREALDARRQLDATERRRAMAYLARAEAQLGNEQALQALWAQLRAEPGPPLAAGEVPAELLLVEEVLRMYDDYGDGEALVATFDATMPQARALLGDDHPFVLALGRYESAVRFYRRDDAGSLQAAEHSFERHRAVLGDGHPETLRALAYFGRMHMEQGRVPEAIVLYERARVAARRALPESSALHLDLLAQQIVPRALIRDFAPLQAEGPALFARFCAAADSRHERCGQLAFGMALAAEATGELADGQRWLEQAEALLRARLGPDHPLLLATLAAAADFRARMGRADAALELLQRVAGMLGSRSDIAPKRYAGPRLSLTFALLHAGRPDLALPLARECYERDLPAGWALHAVAARVYAMALAGVGRRDEALALLDAAWAEELRRPLQRQDRTDLARTLVALHAGDRRSAAYRRWAAELRSQVAAGGFVPPGEPSSQQALRDKG